MVAVDLLAPRSSYCRGAGFAWDADARRLEITVTVKRTDFYLVTELTIDPDFDGRAFQLGKLAGGSDAEADGYAVFVGRRGPAADNCECRGFGYKGHCKHVAAVRGLLANDWI